MNSTIKRDLMGVKVSNQTKLIGNKKTKGDKLISKFKEKQSNKQLPKSEKKLAKTSKIKSVTKRILD